MYVIRSALRASTGRPPARFIRRRRYPATPRFRSLHTTRALAQASNPPTGPDSTPIGENDARNQGKEKGAVEDQAASADDPDVQAQKLQRSRETSRRYSAALRRQQRAKKSQGLPPFHIPDWFLKRRVSRNIDLPEEARHNAKPTAFAVSISHADSGEQATCAIPASRDLDAAQVLSRLVRALWGRRLDDHEKRKVEKYLEERTVLAESPESAEIPEENKSLPIDARAAPALLSPNPTLSTVERQVLAHLERQGISGAVKPDGVTAMEREKLSASDKLQFDKLAKRLSELWTDPTLNGQQRDDALKKQSSKIERWGRKREVAKMRRTSTSNRISPLVLTEIRTTIAAALSTLNHPPGDSFPSAKTNIILHSPTAEHEQLIDACIQGVATELEADLISLNAQDLAQLAGDYLGEGPEPSPRSIRSLGYETYRLSAELHSSMDDITHAVEDDSEFNQPSPMDQADPVRVRAFHLPMIAVGPALKALTQGFRSTHLSAANQFDASSSSINEDTGRAQSQSEMQLEDMKLAAILDALLDANEAKQARGIVGNEHMWSPGNRADQSASSSRTPAFFDYSMGPNGADLELNSALPASAGSGINMNVHIGSGTRASQIPANAKMIHVKDFKELNATHYGGRIIQKLEELVRKRRMSGESIMIVGSTSSRELTPELSASGVRELQGEGETSFFRTIVVEAESGHTRSSLDEAWAASKGDSSTIDISPTERGKFRSINLTHIREMLRSLDAEAAANIADVEHASHVLSNWAPIFPDSYFNRVLTYDEVHRIALTALGLHITNPTDTAAVGRSMSNLNWAHVALAMGLLRASDTTKYALFDRAADLLKKPQNAFERRDPKADAEEKAKRQQDERTLQRQRELQRIATTATKHEKRLMPGIADPDQIKTTFDQVHVPQETIDSIRTITSLSLLRPDAFNYGILATEKISGALLYGPPGTGKTLLAKAVAKESGSTVLEVSGSQVMDKYVGEGEKNVAAVFSLARKLSPCIVFLDEADAMFASRDAMRERTSHRDILNQFLKEWDGLNDLSVFVMVATNRPFDLDDAVIRRLPRRLLVDLPTQSDRKEILRIHLKGEQLDASVDLEDLAKRTPFYSGSDLKNVAVSAALACVKEENEQAAIATVKATIEGERGSDIPPSTSNFSPSTSTSSAVQATKPQIPHLVRGQVYNFPEKRVLHARHFDKALQEISASISEDMSSLNAIKKFDEQYGDRKGKKRKKDFGFGVLAERNENAARVRT